MKSVEEQQAIPPHTLLLRMSHHNSNHLKKEIILPDELKEHETVMKWGAKYVLQITS